MSDKILLFIPAFNCENQICRVLSQLTDDVKKYFKEVIVVNNKSTDSTETTAASAIKNLKGIKATVLRNKENYGLGGSHKVAFEYAIKNDYDFIVVLHGDDQGTIRDLIPLISKGEHRKFDALLGARFHWRSRLSGYSLGRTIGNVVFNFLFSLVLGKFFYDLGAGLNLYSVNALQSGYYKKFPDNLTFNYCMCMAASCYKQQIKFFPISWREDDQVSNVKLFSQALEVLKMLFFYCLKRKRALTSEYRSMPRDKYCADIITSNK